MYRDELRKRKSLSLGFPLGRRRILDAVEQVGGDHTRIGKYNISSLVQTDSRLYVQIPKRGMKRHD